MTTVGWEAGWRAPILEHFPREAATAGRLSVVSDADGLLGDPGIIESFQDRGFELVTLGDPIAFRYLYEKRYRREWAAGETAHLVVVIRGTDPVQSAVPYDLIEEARSHGRELSFGLRTLFPMLAPNVVAELDVLHLDALREAVDSTGPGNLGENATRDFVLAHVFGVAPEVIREPADLLRVLLRQHYRGRPLPESLARRFIERLLKDAQWSAWPLERIVPHREAFFNFLSERWPHFLIAQGHSPVPGREPAAPALPGPLDIPFGHHDLRVYVDDLFAEGLLEPTAAISPEAVGDNWCRVGVAGDPAEDAGIRLRRLLDRLSDDIPGVQSAHGDWMQFAMRWAEAVTLRWQVPAAEFKPLAGPLDALHDDIEAAFAEWMEQRFSAIHSLPHLPTPVTLDKVPHHLDHHRRERDTAKLALLVVDGLSLDQWLVLRESMDDFVLKESSIFAWVPTLTSVSRQAIFAGEPPYFYGPYIGTTYKEEAHWSRFWSDRGLTGSAVGYVVQKRQESDDSFHSRVMDVVQHPGRKVVGIVVGLIDQMIHGTVTGTGGMHAVVRQWAQEGHFRKLVEECLVMGFDVFITADHGNIEARGIGKPNVGAIADERGQRAHVFPHPLTRANVHEAFPQTIPWPQVALPDDYFPLLAPGRSAFIPEGKRTVAHGGISLEEVIVPFVRIFED